MVRTGEGYKGGRAAFKRGVIIYLPPHARHEQRGTNTKGGKGGQHATTGSRGNKQGGRREDATQERPEREGEAEEGAHNGNKVGV